jgi:hypothetical protein
LVLALSFVMSGPTRYVKLIAGRTAELREVLALLERRGMGAMLAPVPATDTNEDTRADSGVPGSGARAQLMVAAPDHDRALAIYHDHLASIAASVGNPFVVDDLEAGDTVVTCPACGIRFDPAGSGLCPGCGLRIRRQ